MTTQDLSWREAILHVLREADELLHYNEITRLVGEQGLRQLSGATPSQTVNRELNSLVQAGEVQNTSRGHYALPETAQRAEEAQVAEETAAEDAAANPERFTVKAYGLYWDRGQVDWGPTNGQIWGQQYDQSRPVNFADQDGIYLLHKGSEIAYIGQTRTERGKSGLYARLRYHHNDRRKSDRWDAFSWFGFRPVADNGDLLPAPDGGNLVDVINVIEAMLIEGLMPRLNMRGGDGSKELRDTGLYFQSSFQKVSRGLR